MTPTTTTVNCTLLTVKLVLQELPGFFVCNPGALFRKSQRTFDFLYSAPSVTYRKLQYHSKWLWIIALQYSTFHWCITITMQINYDKIYCLKCTWIIWNFNLKYALTSPINTTLLIGAAVHLAVLVTLCLACQYSHLDQPLLKMYTKLPLEWVW